MTGSMLDRIRDWLQPIEAGEDVTLAPDYPAQTSAPAPGAFVIDDEDGVCKVIVMTLESMGVTSEKFSSAREVAAALERTLPSVVFLDVALQGSDAIDVIRRLAEHDFRGMVQLMSGSNIELLDDVRRVGARHGLNMRPPLSKPFRPQSIRHVVEEAGLTRKSTAPVSSLDEARKNGWLELWYQPKVDLRKNMLAGAEGLVRCRHPVHGVLAPGSFLPGASESSHSALTEFVITTALRDWNEIAESRVPLHIAVNTSIGALANLQLPALIRENRPKSDDWPGLILEVTESDVVKEASLIHEIATQLRIYRITLAIDDFGEGFSSFGRLRDIPFVELKLDRGFVMNSGTDPRNANICQAIINLAHSFGAVAVAEGIENATDLRAVHRMGCDVGQGFFLAHPMPKADLIALLRERVQKQANV
jgi:EAL domain-containing protein (putative c-di-GMP-specific phosphodiesterase class I)